MTSKIKEIFQVFNGVEINEVLRFLSYAISYGLNVASYMSIGFVFYKPKLLCHNESNNSSYICSEEEACNLYGNKNLIFAEDSLFSHIESVSM